MLTKSVIVHLSDNSRLKQIAPKLDELCIYIIIAAVQNAVHIFILAQSLFLFNMSMCLGIFINSSNSFNSDIDVDNFQDVNNSYDVDFDNFHNSDANVYDSYHNSNHHYSAYLLQLLYCHLQRGGNNDSKELIVTFYVECSILANTHQ